MAMGAGPPSFDCRCRMATAPRDQAAAVVNGIYGMGETQTLDIDIFHSNVNIWNGIYGMEWNGMGNIWNTANF